MLLRWASEQKKMQAWVPRDQLNVPFNRDGRSRDGLPRAIILAAANIKAEDKDLGGSSAIDKWRERHTSRWYRTPPTRHRRYRRKQKKMIDQGRLG